MQKHDHSISDTTLNEVVSAVIDSDILASGSAEGAQLSSKRRKTFVERNYPMVTPFRLRATCTHNGVCSNTLDSLRTV